MGACQRCKLLNRTDPLVPAPNLRAGEPESQNPAPKVGLIYQS